MVIALVTATVAVVTGSVPIWPSGRLRRARAQHAHESAKEAETEEGMGGNIGQREVTEGLAGGTYSSSCWWLSWCDGASGSS